MFNGGGFAHRGTGITSGLTPVRMHEGGRVDHRHDFSEDMSNAEYFLLDHRFKNNQLSGRKTQDDFFEENREMLSKYYQKREPQSRLKAASPALLALSSALLSGKSYQGGVGGALEILGQGLEKSTPYFDDMIKARRAEKNEQRKEQFNLDMQALEWARADKAAEDKKYEPITFGDQLLRLTPDGTYETISSKPSKLVEAYDNQLGDNVFVSESLIRADMEAANKATAAAGQDLYEQRYMVKRTVDKEDLVEVYDTQKKTYTWIPEDTLMAMSKKALADPDYKQRYVAQAPETELVTMYHNKLNKNVVTFKTNVVDSINKGEDIYEAKRDGLDTVKYVHSTALGANIYVTQGELLADMQKSVGERDYGEPKDNPVYKTFFDPSIKENVLATDEMVAERLDSLPLFAYEPKHTDKSDTILTMWHKKDKHNMLVTEADVLANMDAYEPEHKQDATKSAINTKTNKLEFVTNQQIAESDGKYIPAIIGNTLTIGPDGTVVMKSTLVGAGMGDETSNKMKDLRTNLDDITIFATDVLRNMENDNNIDSAFGITGWLIDFSNKYLTQVGLPFNEQVAEARTDIVELSNRVMRLVTQDQRFTNEDREFINRMTGLAAMDKIQSYDQVLIGVRQIQTMLEDRVSEISGAQGMKASHEMGVQEMIAAYNNYRKVNNIDWPGSDTFTIESNLPKFNKQQLARRLELFHPGEWAKIQLGEF